MTQIVNDLLRRRESLLRGRQLWIAGLVIWGVVVGWVVWGLVNALSDDVDVLLAWLAVWLLPVIVLATGSLLAHRRLRACEAALVEAERRP